MAGENISPSVSFLPSLSLSVPRAAAGVTRYRDRTMRPAFGPRTRSVATARPSAGTASEITADRPCFSADTPRTAREYSPKWKALYHFSTLGLKRAIKFNTGRKNFQTVYNLHSLYILSRIGPHSHAPIKIGKVEDHFYLFGFYFLAITNIS